MGAPKTPATLELDPLLELVGDNPPAPAPSRQPAARAPVPSGVPVAAPSAGTSAPSLSFSFDENDPFALADEGPKASPAPAPARTARPVPLPAPAPARNDVLPSFDGDDPFALPAPSPAPARSAAPDPFALPAPSPAPARSAAPDPFALPAPSPAPARSAAPDPFALPDPSLELPPAGDDSLDLLEGNNPFVSFAGPAPAPAPTPGPARTDPFALPAPSPAPARSAEPDPFALPDLASSAEPDPFALPDPASSAEPDPFALPDPASSAAPDPFAMLADHEAPAPARHAAPDPFASPAPAPGGALDPFAMLAQDSASASTQASSRNELFSMPAPSAAPARSAPASEGRSLLGDLPMAGAPAEMPQDPFARPPMSNGPSALPEPPRPPPPVMAPSAEKKKTEAPSVPQGRPLSQRLAGVAAHMVVAAVLGVGLMAVGSAWLNDGRVDLAALSPSRMREGASARTLVARELANGLYETRAGRPLFFVRGEVENRGSAPAQVVARVSLYDGEQRVKSAEGLVGAMPTVEDLYSLQDAKSAAALRERLDAGASAVAPGARVPFIVFFHEYPEELADFRLEVALENATQEGKPAHAEP